MKINIEPHALDRIKLIRLTAIHPIYGTKEVLAQMDHSEAIELAKALLAITEQDNPAKPKETTQDWIREAAIDIADYFPHDGDDTGRPNPEIEAIIRKHAKGWLADCDSDWLTVKYGKDLHERDETIAMLSQQLQDKTEIIRKLTT